MRWLGDLCLGLYLTLTPKRWSWQNRRKISFSGAAVAVDTEAHPAGEARRFIPSGNERPCKAFC